MKEALKKAAEDAASIASALENAPDELLAEIVRTHTIPALKRMAGELKRSSKGTT